MYTSKGGAEHEEDTAVREQGAGGEGRRSDPGDAVVQRRDREGEEQAAVEPEQIYPGVLPADDRSAEHREEGY